MSGLLVFLSAFLEPENIMLEKLSEELQSHFSQTYPSIPPPNTSPQT